MAKYFVPYELAVKELTVKFKHMIEEYHENDRYSPIEQVSGRVKSVSSILEKMQRKDIPIEQLETEMEDLAGVRIICQFERRYRYRCCDHPKKEQIWKSKVKRTI